MPIFRLPQGLGLFVDVSGCLGNSLIHNLERRFGPLGFHDPTHSDAPRHKRWSRTSPQHVGRATLARLFPPDFFAMRFAVVRHPVDRLRAVYVDQQGRGMVPQTTSFSDWLDDITERLEAEPFVFDNAVRPMADLVPDDARVFRLEDGVEALSAWLDEIGGPGPAVEPATSPQTEVGPLDLDRIAEIHAADFRHFGYALEPQATVPPLPPRRSRLRLGFR